ncbi:glycosyltransferase family 4 protein [Geobacillus sp. CAMR5420]|uniref:glycosyltransferase family 4 protein n=1 Tax=Geobacillus sp. CAMR5420 TaxID=1482739 RepID=UPI00049F5FDB|nr:glycosyltransferase family 4 protein [Geobacillus sp. CAMR5420]KDE46151.1 glycosyl transferase [Geobacillus sp. CAMR5420]
MNVLFLTLAYPEGKGQRNIYTDLMQEFYENGDTVYVVCQRERRSGKPTEFKIENGIHVLRVRTGNVTKTNIIEKGISTILLEGQFIKAIRKFLNDVKFNLVLYSTPPITFERVVKYVKERDGCKSYLLLKDIFPQNAVDIGMIRENSLIWHYFRAKEKRLYEISDYIGCMSPANVQYVLKHNPEIDRSKVEECPNSIKPSPLRKDDVKRSEIRRKYGIPEDSVVFIYGGNLGRPQGIGFLLEVIDYMKDRTDVFFLIVGSGTEYEKIKQHLEIGCYRNAKLFKFLPKEEYDVLLNSCDVGLIFLDPRFTIPNFPSRLTAYMEAALPVAAATDVNTDLKDILREAGCGMWAENGDLKNFCAIIDTLASDSNLRYQMGLNGRKYLEKYYTVSRAYKIITSHLKKQELNK